MNNSDEQNLFAYSFIARTILFLLIFTSVLSAQGSWNQLDPPNAPSERQGHSMTTLPDGKVYLFGGEGPQEDLFNDLYIFQETDWEEVEPDGDKPLPRSDAAAWVRENIFYLHGGRGANDEAYDDLWTYDSFLNQWQEVELNGEKPSGRFSHSAAVLEDGTVLISGGQTGENSYTFETWLYDPTADTFEQKSSIPFPSSEQSSVATKSQVIPLQVFGENQEMIYYDKQSDSWTNFLPLPEDEHPGLIASAAYCDAGKNGAYVIGGEEFVEGSGYQMSKKVWKFDLITKTWSAVTELVDILLHAEVVYDKLNDRLLLFGGKDEAGNYVNLMYEYQFNPTGVNDKLELQNDFYLTQNYPNPFNPSTTIHFSVPSVLSPKGRTLTDFSSQAPRNDNLHVSIIVYDALGRQVTTLINERKSFGVYEVQFNDSTLPSGVYYYRIIAGDFVQTRKMLLMK